jgi:hypothetical protein
MYFVMGMANFGIQQFKQTLKHIKAFGASRSACQDGLSY